VSAAAPSEPRYGTSGRKLPMIGSKLDPSLYQCFGCGAELQMDDEEQPGFLVPEKYMVKKQHRQLRTTLCLRCGDLSNGAMLNAIAGQAHAAFNDPSLISPDELREQLQPLQNQKALVIKVVDILDFNGSFMNRIRDLVGSNPIVLVVTKSDLLPKGTDMREVTEWVRERAEGRRLTIAGVHMVSSRSGEGVDYAVGTVLRERRGRPVYILGAANVGKSTFVRAFLKQLKQQDLSAIAAARHSPTVSPMPGTTLGVIPIPAFGPREKRMFDTAGVLLTHRLNALLNESELKAVMPRGRLRPYIPNLLEEVSEGLSPLGTTYLWGAVVRVDVLEAPRATRLSFLGPQSLKVSAMATPAEANQEESSWVYVPEPAEGTEMFGLETVQITGGLRVSREVVFGAVPSAGQPMVDVAISGLGGWFSVYTKADHRGQYVKLRVWTPKGVEVFLRPPLPLPTRVVL